MARLLVVPDDREDVYVEISDDGLGNLDGRCTCGEITIRQDLDEIVRFSVHHVDRTHGGLR